VNGSARVATGLDTLVAESFRRLRGERVGVIANPTSVDSRMCHLADLLHNSSHVHLAALFGPEHGVRADAQDMIGVGSDRDTRTGVVVHSLYGSGPSSLTPTPEQLSGLDVLVFDIQDVGSRYYTFAATMLYALKAAAAAGLRFLVLDRPNPLGGEVIEGPTLQPGFASFVGAHSIPIRHGLTVGELARLECAELGIDVELDVIACEGWRREMLWADTGLSWVLPSPNMPTPDTALVYPGGCLVEGTNLSEGRGTTRPFELWGAPWLDPYPLVEHVGETPGALLRPCAFRSTFHKHAGQLCLGVQPHVVDPAAFRSVSLYTRFLAAARAQAPDQFRWRTEPYEFVRDPIAIDLLYGSARERLAIEAWSEENFQAISHAWAAEEAAFRARREPHLLYKV
jgi:uncharacterized protein YbbC (DUF1343 family)